MTGSELRQLCLRALVVAFALAGLAGVIAVLSGGGHPAGRVVLSAASLAVYSTIALTLATRLDTRAQPVAVPGLGLCLAGLGLALIACWVPHPHGTLIRLEFAALALSLTVAQTATVAELGDTSDPPPAFELVRLVCYVAAMVLSALLVVAILHDHGAPSDSYWRALGATVIVDIVAAVILGLLTRLAPGAPAQVAPAQPAPAQPAAAEPATADPAPATAPQLSAVPAQAAVPAAPVSANPATPPPAAPARARSLPALGLGGRGVYAVLGAVVIVVGVVVLLTANISTHHTVTGPSDSALAGRSTAQRYCVLKAGMSQAEVERIMRGRGRPSNGLELLLFHLGSDVVRTYRTRGGELGVVYRQGTAHQFAATAPLPGSCPNG